jgi:hypothetical protein
MHTEGTERTWWLTPRTAKRRKPASGGTPSGSRHILGDPTWVIVCKSTRNKKQVGGVMALTQVESATSSTSLVQSHVQRDGVLVHQRG